MAALLATAAPSVFAAPAKKAPGKKAPVRKPATVAGRKPASDAALDDLKEAAGIEIAPASIALDGPRSLQHLVVTATMKDGATADVTDRVAFSIANPRLLKISGGILYPVADGETRITAKIGRLASNAGVTVRHAGAPASVEFVNDIMPILSKAGCNSTACHGSPVGKGGFKLSLFGYEPELDQPAIVKDADGKRVNLKDPARSMVLQKATMMMPHAGGQRIKVDSPEYRTMLAWLKAGAPAVGEFEARVRQVVVTPEQPWIPAPGAKQHLAVTAFMTDGSAQDVTDKALFSSNDDAIADVDGGGLVSAKRPGETVVMVRYLGQVAISRVAVLPPWKLDRYPRVAKNNYIDELVQDKLKKLRVVPSDLCTDEEFVRRATLDACGIIPKPDEVRQFVADTSPNKRAKLVDKLLDRSEFVDLWTTKWNDTLRNNPQLTRRGLLDYYKWIRAQISTNRPYNEWVKELVTASGKNVEATLTVDMLPPNLQNRPRVAELLEQLNKQPFNAAANYFTISKDPLDTTSATSQIFLGVRIECSRCHNHPFEKWTQNDYYGLAAFFNGITARGQNQVATVVFMNPRAPSLRHPKTNEVVEPKVLDETDVKVAPGADRRVALADWMTSPSNPWFAKALVNRLWGYYFGRGIVDPVDDFRVTNPASNPDLLDALAKDFVAHKFDVKYLHRTILNSSTYQASSRPNKYNRLDTNNFARYYPKRMMAEQVYDSISQATDVFIQAGGLGRGRYGKKAGVIDPSSFADGPITRAMQLPAVPQAGRGAGNGPGVFLNTFGKPRREVVCECERSSEGNMGQALALINGDEVNRKIAAPFGRVQGLVRGGKPDAQVIEELYLATLSRRPTATELNEAGSLLRSAKSRGEGVEDLMWSLLNSREFLFIH